MRKISLLLLLLAGKQAQASFSVEIGPHFHYTTVEFDTPTDIKGYAAGITAGVTYTWCYLFSRIEFEGTWNAGPITGTPCERSDLQEYFLEGQLGGCFSFCCDQLVFQPYTGFGWDRYENEQEPKTIGLCHRYDKLFVPLGFHLDWIFYNYNRVGIQFEWRPDVTACLTLLGIDLDTECRQAFRVQAPIRFHNDPCCPCGFWVEVVPFFDWNAFGKVKERNSDGVRLPIPSLIRWNLGLRLLFGWEF